MTFGSLAIKFGAAQTSPAPQGPKFETVLDLAAQEQTILTMELEAKAEQIALLAQEDPELYERLVESGELVDDQRVRGFDEDVSGGGGV